MSEERLISRQRSFSAELPSTTRSTYAITFSADNKYAAASTGDHNIHIIEINSGKIVKTLKGKSFKNSFIIFSCRVNSKALLISMQRFWLSPFSRKNEFYFRPHANMLERCVSPDKSASFGFWRFERRSPCLGHFRFEKWIRSLETRASNVTVCTDSENFNFTVLSPNRQCSTHR